MLDAKTALIWISVTDAWSSVISKTLGAVFKNANSYWISLWGYDLDASILNGPVVFPADSDIK